MYSTHPGKTHEQVMIDISKSKINKQYRKDYEYIKQQGRYLAMEDMNDCSMVHSFAFYDTETKKLVKFNNRNIWVSVEQFKNDWFIDTKKTDMRPWQDYVAMLSISEDDENCDTPSPTESWTPKQKSTSELSEKECSSPIGTITDSPLEEILDSERVIAEARRFGR